MSTSNTKLVWRKLAPGMYEAAAGRVDFTGREGTNRYLAESIDQDPANGYGAGVMWVLTYPGAVVPDSNFETLRDAKAAAQAWHDIDVEVIADDEDFHCCDADEDLDYGDYSPWATVRCAGCGAEMEYNGDGTSNAREEWAPMRPVRRP